MPIYMDVHRNLQAKPEEVAMAHSLDLEVQTKYGVHYTRYWHNVENGCVYCLVEAPSIVDAIRVHKEAHGLVAEQLIEVTMEQVDAFLGSQKPTPSGTDPNDGGFRVVMFTDIVGSTALGGQLGDQLFHDILKTHNAVIRDDDGETLFNGTWYALLYGAAAAWQPAPADIADFQKNFGRVFHGDTTGRIDLAQQKLIAAHALLRTQHLHFASDWLFWMDPWSGEGVEAMRLLRPIAPQLRVLAEEALRLTLQAQATSPREPDALAAMALGARRIDLIGQKAIFADQMVSMYGDALRLSADTLRHGDTEEELSSIAGMNGRMQDMRDSYSLLRDLYEQAWLRENRPYWLHNVLALYDVATDTWVRRIERLEDARIHWRRTRHLPTASDVGLPVPADSTVAASPAPGAPASPAPAAPASPTPAKPGSATPATASRP